MIDLTYPGHTGIVPYDNHPLRQYGYTVLQNGIGGPAFIVSDKNGVFLYARIRGDKFVLNTYKKFLKFSGLVDHLNKDRKLALETK